MSAATKINHSKSNSFVTLFVKRIGSVHQMNKG